MSLEEFNIGLKKIPLRCAVQLSKDDFDVITNGGTMFNGKRVRVAGAKKVTDALVVNNVGASRDPAVNVTNTDRLLALLHANVRGLRNSGSAAQNMMDVACGRLDA